MYKRIFTFILMCIFIISCTSCGTEKVESENDHINDSEESTNTNMSEAEEVIQWDNTYTTRLAEANGVSTPIFSFDYPANWKISNEDIEDTTEIVELINENGILIRYTYMASSFSYGNPRYEVEVEISKIADSSFIPGYAQTRDYSNLGEFAVVKVISDSQIYYVVKPEYECGTHSVEGNFMTGFWYDGLLEFMAEIPEGITLSDEREVIDILASFRASDNRELSEEQSKDEEIDPTYSALQNGDFSEFTGTYRPMGIYEEWYGGGEAISDLFLDEKGIVTEGGMSYYSNPYPEEKPVSVTKNEDGSYRCQVRYASATDQDYFLIYPKGTIGENPYIYNDPFLTEHVYLQYMSINGGVMDIIYYKVED